MPIMRTAFIALTLLLTACAGPIETRVESTGLSKAAPTSFMIDPDLVGPAAGVQAKVSSLLGERGFRLADNGVLQLRVTASDRPAELALQSGAKEISPSAGKAKCAKREYRVGVTLTRISDGTDYYRASAAEFHCKLTIDEVMPTLVSAALADLGAPRGPYTLTRPRPGEFRLIPAT
jgi:hypothetical protein